MRRDELVARLTQLGLEPDEAEAYVELYVIGPCRAGGVADALNVHQTKAYWSMNHLVKKGFAEAVDSAPTRYKALEPDEICAEMLQDHRRKIQEIEETWDDLRDPLAALREQGHGDVAEDTYRLIHGRKEVLDVAGGMFDRAEDEILAFSVNPWAHLTPESYDRLWDKGIERARDGLQARGIFHTTPEMREFLAPMLDIEDLDIRHLGPRRNRPFLVVDRSEIVYWLVTDPSTDRDAEREVAVWSNAPDLIEEHREIFLAQWEQAIDIRDAEARAAQGDGGVAAED